MILNSVYFDKRVLLDVENLLVRKKKKDPPTPEVTMEDKRGKLNDLGTDADMAH
jgi:hypothetical protein